MKKNIAMIVATFVALLGCGLIYFLKPESDAIKFKKEYESLNNQEAMDGVNYPEVSIDAENSIKYISLKEAVSIIKNGNGIIYVGWSTCPWCRNAVPVLLKAAKESGLKNIYYVNIKDSRDEYSLVDGVITKIKDGTKEYADLLAALGDKASVYSGLNNDDYKRVYAPTVISVKDKNITIHQGTVDSQENPFVKLDENQEMELYNIYKKMIVSFLGSSCDEKC